MKLHISDSQTLAKHRENFQGHHAFDLPGRKVISIGKIPDILEEAFIADGAVSLPHFLDSSAIGPEAAAALAHLGIKPEHRSFDVLMVVGKIHPAFKPSALG